jgi:hypothetical protein
MLLQSRDRWAREPNHSPAGVGLRLDEDQTPAALALQSPFDLKPASDEIDVAPPESQCLADPQAGSAKKHPERMPAGVAAGLEEDLQLGG